MCRLNLNYYKNLIIQRKIQMYSVVRLLEGGSLNIYTPEKSWFSRFWNSVHLLPPYFWYCQEESKWAKVVETSEGFGNAIAIVLLIAATV